MQFRKVVRHALKHDGAPPSVLTLKLVLLAPPVLLAFGSVRVPYFPQNITFATALVGNTHGGMAVQVQQVLPPGSWLQVREGGCLLGKGMHLVVDPERPDVEESLADSNFIGRHLCDWLSLMLAHHDAHTAKSRTRRRKTEGALSTLWKSSTTDTFLSAMHVTLTHLDLEEHEELPDSPGHIPMPWARLTFTYYSNAGEGAIHFCGTSSFCNQPAYVHVLLTPELSAELQTEAGLPVEEDNWIPSRSRNADEDNVSEISPTLSNAFQMIPVRTFHWLEPECICLDGRLVAPSSSLCSWAQQQRQEFPSASATLMFTSISLFLGKYAQITGRLQLENPTYRLHARSITLHVKPQHSRAVLTRKHYYDKEL